MPANNDKMKTISIGIIALLLVLTSYSVIAPIWYGSGDDAGLVGRWSCEGNFLDSSGNGHDIVPQNGSSITGGIKGRACDFTKTNTYAETSSGFKSTTNESSSFVFWVKKTYDTSNTIVYLAGGASFWITETTSNDNLTLTWYRSGGWESVTSNYSVPDNEWVNLAVVFEYPDIYYYSNGVLVDNRTTVYPLGVNSDPHTMFGYYTTDCDNDARGLMDEVRIYNRSLSATEISALYDTGKSYKIVLKSTPTLGGMNETPAPALTDESGLVGHWKLDGDATDSSGEGNDGTPQGTNPFSTTDARWEQAYQFNGAETINITTSESLDSVNNSGAFTAWIKADSFACAGGLCTVYDHTGTGNGGVFLMIRNDTTSYPKTIHAGFNNGTTQLPGRTTTTLQENKWYFLAMTWAGEMGYVYVNGILENTTVIPNGEKLRGNYPRMIGSNYGVGRWFYGQIDEVRVYNRSLSADEIKGLYLSKGLVGHWKMDADQKNSTSTFDSSGYNNHGLISGAVQTNEGRFKEGYKFDGVNDFINITNEPTFDFERNDSFSGFAWIKGNKKATSIFGKMYNGIPFTGWDFEITGTTGYLSLYLINTWTSNSICVRSNIAVDDNQWHHVGFTYNGTNATGVNLFIDGSNIVETVVYNSLNTSILNEQDFKIGARTAGEFFNGTIDEVRIYNRALSATEVAGLYNGTRSNKIVFKTDPELGMSNETPAPTVSDETGLVGYWKMDDYVNGNTTDSSGNGRNGNVITGTIVNDGRWGNAFHFNGTGYIYSSAVPSFSSFTLSNWIKLDPYETQWMTFYRRGNIGTSNGTLYMYNDAANSAMISVYADNGTRYNNGCSACLLTNNWNHVVATYDNATHSSNIYVNGVLKGSAAAGSFYYGTSNQPMYFPTQYSGGYNNNGTFDEFRIYNRSLSADEVKELYLSKGLIGHWKMDADQRNTTDTYDNAGYYNHGTLVNAVLTNQGRFKEAYQFDGNGDYINVGVTDNSSLDIDKNEITQTAWIYPIANVAYGTIATRNGGYYFQRHSDGKLGAYQYGTSPAGYHYSTGTTPLNQWSFAAYTYNGTYLTFYINGEASGGVAKTGNITQLADYINYPFRIGWDASAGARYFNGTIDDVRVYNRALTAQEIAALYNGTRSNKIVWKSVVG